MPFTRTVIASLCVCLPGSAVLGADVPGEPPRPGLPAPTAVGTPAVPAPSLTPPGPAASQRPAVPARLAPRTGAVPGQLPASVTQPRPAPPKPVIEGTPKFDLEKLQRELKQIREQRDTLDRLRKETARGGERMERTEAETNRLRLRLAELLTRANANRPAPPVAQPRRAEASAPEAGEDPRLPALKGPPPSSVAATATWTDSMALAQSRFQAGDYAGALQAYQDVPRIGLRPDEQMPVLYMIATCHRQLGRLDEAATLYQEVAAAQGDPLLAECAQWQLSSLHWRNEMRNQLNDIRQRMQALETKP